jgi:nitrogen fixation protein NifU and related proteins
MDNQDGTDWVYSEEVKKHFFEPQNILMEDSETFNADGVGYVGSPACGDMMKIWIKVDKDSDKIIDLKWKTFGCASAIASTSVLSVMVLENGGMKIEDAIKITPKEITTRLSGLPDRKIHCSVLGDQALQAAVNNYFSKSGQADRIVKEDVHVVCDCLGVTNHEISEAVLEGAKNYHEVQGKTKCGTGCGSCKGRVEGLIEQYKAQYFEQ